MLSEYVKRDYDKKLRATNNVVVIRKLEKYHTQMAGPIIIPESFSKGFNLCKGIVESVGPKAQKENIKVGDEVLYDHYAGHYLTDPIVCVNVENVIVILKEGEKS